MTDVANIPYNTIMTSDHILIGLYCDICQLYNTRLADEVQRQSNNFCPKFTDEECITIYIWGITKQKFDVKAVYDFIKEQYTDWFPTLPSYQAFNNRICYLSDAFHKLADIIVSELVREEINDTYLIDSLPITVANSRRSSKAVTASELCDKGYCASKGMYYYGVKLHVLAQSQYKTIPSAALLTLSSASEHDLAIAKQFLDDVKNIDIFADKAYKNKTWENHMESHNNVEILMPIKLKKGQKRLDSADRLLSSAISQVRQPIESFFSWLQRKTRIQHASNVRSTKGLISFIYARIAAAYISVAM